MVQDGLNDLSFGTEMKGLLDRSIKRMYAAIFAVEEKLNLRIQNSRNNEYL